MKTFRIGLALGALALVSYSVGCGGSSESSSGSSGSSKSGSSSGSKSGSTGSSGDASGSKSGSSGDGESGGKSGSGDSGKTGSTGSSGVGESGGKSGDASGGKSGGTSGGTTGGTTGGASGGSSTEVTNETFVNEGGWFAKDSNPWGMQGSCYAYSDPVSVTTPEGGKGNAWDATAKGYCIAGATVEDSTYANWGGGIGCDLGGAEEDPDGLNKTAFVWKTAHVTGFKLNYALEKGTQVVRIMFPTEAAYTDGSVAPFVVGKGAGTYNIADAKVPATWKGVPNAGKGVDGAPIYSVQVQVVGADKGADGEFKLCLTEFMPVVE